VTGHARVMQAERRNGCAGVPAGRRGNSCRPARIPACRRGNSGRPAREFCGRRGNSGRQAWEFWPAGAGIPAGRRGNSGRRFAIDLECGRPPAPAEAGAHGSPRLAGRRQTAHVGLSARTGFEPFSAGPSGAAGAVSGPAESSFRAGGAAVGGLRTSLIPSPARPELYCGALGPSGFPAHFRAVPPLEPVREAGRLCRHSSLRSRATPAAAQGHGTVRSRAQRISVLGGEAARDTGTPMGQLEAFDTREQFHPQGQ
jgi:hypothetical protein